MRRHRGPSDLAPFICPLLLGWRFNLKEGFQRRRLCGTVPSPSGYANTRAGVEVRVAKELAKDPALRSADDVHVIMDLACSID